MILPGDWVVRSLQLCGGVRSATFHVCSPRPGALEHMLGGSAAQCSAYGNRNGKKEPQIGYIVEYNILYVCIMCIYICVNIYIDTCCIIIFMCVFKYVYIYI